MNTRTADGLALEIMLSNRTAAQRKAALVALAAQLTPAACPECGGTNLDDNGTAPSSYDHTVCCTACGHQWCPNND